MVQLTIWIECKNNEKFVLNLTIHNLYGPTEGSIIDAGINYREPF